MSLDVAVIILVPTSTADYNQTTISESWDAEVTLTYQATPAPSTDGLEITLSDLPHGGMWLQAHADQIALLPAVTDVEVTQKRTIAAVSLAVATPAIVAGIPSSPAYWGQSTTSVTQTGGAAITNYVPASGLGTYRWSADLLPSPDPYGGSYRLGVRTTADGSSQLPSTCGAWSADPATGGPSWNSIYPWKPTVGSYTHVNKDGTQFKADQVVHFHNHTVQHMWTTFSGTHTMPFTWIIAGIIVDGEYAIYNHHLLDSGKQPTVSGRTEATANVGDLPGTGEGLNYRTRLIADRNYMYVGNSNQTIRGKHPMSGKPVMYYGIWNNTSSYVGMYSVGQHYQFKGKVYDTANHVNYVLGRSNGIVDAHWASSMLLFEMRYFTSALALSDVLDQYKHISSYWSFGRYK